MLISRIRKKTHVIMWMFLGIFLIGGVFLAYGVFLPGGRGRTVQTQSGQRSHVPADVLSVDGKKVSMELFNYEYLRIKRKYESSGEMRFDSYPMIMFLKSQVLEFLTTQELLMQEARKRNVRADSAEVGKRIRQEEDFMLGPVEKKGGAGAVGGIKDFFAAKDREKQFRESITRTGASYDTFKMAVQRDVIQAKVVDMIAADQMKTEEAAAREKALDIIKKLKTGEPFQNVAAQYSEDEASKNNGGDLGWVKRGMLRQPFEDAAFKLQPGQITDQPVKTEDGFHVIQLLEKKEAVGPEFEAQKQQIIASIRAQKGDETANVTMSEIKRAYEGFHARHILVRMKTKDQIASDWLRNEREKGKHKIVVINPELEAYKYTYSAMFTPGATQPNPDKAIEKYEKAASAEPTNPYPHYEMANLYKRKSSEEAMKNAGGLNDPYAKAITEDKKSAPAAGVKADKGKEKYLDEALRELKRAKEISVTNSQYDPMIIIALADMAKTLGQDNLAIENYVEAVDPSAGNKQFLAQIEAGLTGYKSKKALAAMKDAKELLAELDAIDKENARKNAEATGAPEAPPQPAVEQPSANQQPAGKTGAKAPSGKPVAAPGKPIAVRTFKVGSDGKAVEVTTPKTGQTPAAAAKAAKQNASPVPPEAPTPVQPAQPDQSGTPK
jgi:parvulin-like peptidyl-prolyl isomerase